MALAVGLIAPREPVVVEVERIVTVPVEIEVERIVTVVVTPVPTVPEAIPTPSLAALQQEARTVCRTIKLAAGQGIVEARSLAAAWVKDRYGDRPDATDLIEPCARGIINGRVSGESAVARRAPTRAVARQPTAAAGGIGSPVCRQALAEQQTGTRGCGSNGQGPGVASTVD